LPTLFKRLRRLNPIVALATTQVFFAPALLVVALALPRPGLAQGASLMNNSLKEVKVEHIKTEGNSSVDRSLIINSLQIKEGESYLQPEFKQKVSGSVKALFKLDLFSDVQVFSESPDTVEGVIITFSVKELPTLARYQLNGQDKLKKDDLKDAMDLLEGQPFSKADVERNRLKILGLYQNKGYLLVAIKTREEEEKETGRRIVHFDIEEGKKVYVRYITFEGNKHLKDKELRKVLKTKEERWWRSGDYKEDDYRLGLDTLLDFYREQGYLDAAVKGEKITYTTDKKALDIKVDVNEGRRYYFKKAIFVHNNIIEDAPLKAQVILDSGEIFNRKKYDLMKFQVLSLYREEGYLFADIDDRFTYTDSLIEVTFRIKENSLAHINLVDIRGNTKTKDKVIRREVRLFPGDIFRQSMLMRSQRDIMQLAFFDNVEPDIERVQEGDGSDVNLVMKVSEKQAGTGQFSAGAAYSQRDEFVGTLGLQIPNFLGNGQRFDASVEAGPYKQLYSLGFTEPWFLDRPTLVGGSLFYSHQKGNITGENDYTKWGGRANLGQRLTWPDDYFTARSSYNLTWNDNGQAMNSSHLIIPSGLESSVNLTLTRDDKDLPFFPTEGSRYSFSYNLVGGYLGGDFDYREYTTKVNWWFPTFGKLVLGLETEFGLLEGDNIQSYSLYQMGGVLGYQGKLRGYGPGSIAVNRVGRSYFSAVSELTYPVVENTFYLLGFFDMGNVFGSLTKYDPTRGYGYYNPIPKEGAPSALSEVDFADLRKDFGFGFRLVVPMVAPYGMGFDFGWPLDDVENYNGTRSKPIDKSPTVNFVIEQGF
jgi:outer membrane protein assembly complex protein YaeT